MEQGCLVCGGGIKLTWLLLPPAAGRKQAKSTNASSTGADPAAGSFRSTVTSPTGPCPLKSENGEGGIAPVVRVRSTLKLESPDRDFPVCTTAIVSGGPLLLRLWVPELPIVILLLLVVASDPRPGSSPCHCHSGHCTGAVRRGPRVGLQQLHTTQAGKYGALLTPLPSPSDSGTSLRYP